MKSAPRTAHYTNPDPTHCDDEYLPSVWHTLAEQKGFPDEETYKHWKRFKDITRWPFERRRWFAYIEKVVSNKRGQENNSFGSGR